MIKIDLVTGFLGSGKTTFIRRYARYLLDQGKRIAIVENDYGAINVDMMLLKELEGDNCDLEMVIGGNDYDCHKRRLKSKLITLGMLGYDRVIVEPSGIFDVDEFLDTLHEDPIDRWYSIGSIISIVDSKLSENLSEESDYLLVSQTGDAGAVVFSKSEDAGEGDLKQTIAHINRAFDKFGCSRRLTEDDRLLTKGWEDYTEEDFRLIEGAGYVLSDHVKLPIIDENEYQSLFYMNVEMDADYLSAKAEEILSDPSCGHVIRIKGFLHTPGNEQEWMEVNATREKVTVRPSDLGQAVIIVIGEQLDQERIGSYWTFGYGSGREYDGREGV